MVGLSRSFKPRHLPIKDENGLILSTKSKVIKRWLQYCEKLIASYNTGMLNQRETWDDSEPPLLQSKIEMTIKRLCNHKAPGLDEIVVEMIKATAEKGVWRMVKGIV